MLSPTSSFKENDKRMDDRDLNSNMKKMEQKKPERIIGSCQKELCGGYLKKIVVSLMVW